MSSEYTPDANDWERRSCSQLWVLHHVTWGMLACGYTGGLWDVIAVAVQGVGVARAEMVRVWGKDVRFVGGFCWSLGRMVLVVLVDY